MASAAKDDDLYSFDVPETTRNANGPTMYKIILQVTPKDITKNGYQVNVNFFFKNSEGKILLDRSLETLFRYSKIL